MTPEQFLGFAHVLPEPLLLVTGEGEILASNSPVATLIGCKNKELQGKNLFELVRESQEKVLTYLQACSRCRQMVIGSLSFLLPDGQVLICRTEGAVIKPSSANSPALNLLRLETRAAASSEFILLNQKINELTKEIYQRQQAEAALAKKNEELQEVIHQLKAAQMQLIQTEKMLSLGQLVAGVAHEINNPVNFIHGNLVYVEEYLQNLLELMQVYQEEYPHTSNKIQEKIEAIDFNFIVKDLKKVLQSMQVGTYRIVEIIESLQNFSRLDQAEVKAVDIHEGIESTLIILQHRLKAQPNRPKIQVIKDYGNLPLIDCSPSQLNQVFMNILSNAIDALDESFVISNQSGRKNNTDQEKLIEQNPTIWICTKQLDNCLSQENSNCVVIDIADNGSGIPEPILQQIFDPFFTTKPVGQGTGLGLSISYQIVNKNHRGHLHCISDPGQRTEFIIELPIHRKATEELETLIRI